MSADDALLAADDAEVAAAVADVDGLDALVAAAIA